MVGIVGYGAHIPRHRIKVEEIAKVWGADAPSYKRGLMLREKSVPTPDCDTITLSVEAIKNAFRRAEYGLAVGGDTSRGAPCDDLEYSVSANNGVQIE